MENNKNTKRAEFFPLRPPSIKVKDSATLAQLIKRVLSTQFGVTATTGDQQTQLRADRSRE